MIYRIAHEINDLNTMNNSKFDYDISSDSNYDFLIADVLYENELILNVSQDAGPQSPKLCFFYPQNKIFWNVPLDPMFEIVHAARKDLNENLTEDQFDIYIDLEQKKLQFNELDYKIIFDSQQNGLEALIMYNHKKMCELYNNNLTNQWFLKIFPNPEKKQDFYESQWEVFLLEFKLIFDAATQELGKYIK